MIRVVTRTRAGHAVLSVFHSGPVAPAAEVERLFQALQQGGADRTGHRDGLLGLSIVHAIAAGLTAQAQPDGGLDIGVSFPA